jgi:Lhr-like helicase
VTGGAPDGRLHLDVGTVASRRAQLREHFTQAADLLLERLRRHNGQGEKVLVFTAFRQTLDALAARLEREGVPAAIYHGSLSLISRRSRSSSTRSASRARPPAAVCAGRSDDAVLLRRQRETQLWRVPGLTPSSSATSGTGFPVPITI